MFFTKLQVEPFLYYTWAWVKFVCIMRRLKIFFRAGLILNDIKILDPWIYCLYNMIFL